jgi:cytochrome o ubiquinol oxidase subunit 3
MNPSLRTQLGFWIYLMTDCMLFASLFAVYAVSHTATAGLPGPKDLFELPLVLVETILLLVSSFTCGLAMILATRKRINYALGFLVATFVLGIAFLFVELHEFDTLIFEGYDWRASAFLSSFFVLVATHGLHIFIGLVWLLVLIVLLMRRGLTDKLQHKLKLFGLFWHFLDLVWIFIFTIVYLGGVAV